MERRRLDAFELWCWRRLLRVLWTARRSNQSVLKEISPEYSLERLMLKLKLQYFCHLMWKVNSLEKTLMLGKTEVKRRRAVTVWDGYIALLTQEIWSWTISEKMVKEREAQGAAVHGVTKVKHNLATEQQQCIITVICVPILRNKKIFLKNQKTVIELRPFTSSTLTPEGSWKKCPEEATTKDITDNPPSEVLEGMCEREGKCVPDSCCWELTGDLTASRS